jgi:inorganic pyrophosphatase
MRRGAHGEPDRLPTLNDDDRYLAVIEASALSRNKFKFEPKFGTFVLHSVLPTGTSFPHAFGFIPSTLGEDGDPLDIVVLCDEPPPVASVVPCRIVAILEAEQVEDGKRIRNDRILGVAACSERFEHCRKRGDIDKTILDRIGSFFKFYHAEQGKKFEPLGWKSHKTAEKLIEKGRAQFARKHRGGTS